MRLIDADKLIELIDDDIASLDEDMPREGDSVCRCTLKMVKQYINALPTVEAEPIKHGRWIEDEYGFLVCSECGNTAEYLPILGQIETPYCSECGARMDEVEE